MLEMSPREDISNKHLPPISTPKAMTPTAKIYGRDRDNNNAISLFHVVVATRNSKVLHILQLGALPAPSAQPSPVESAAPNPRPPKPQTLNSKSINGYRQSALAVKSDLLTLTW